jgi:hypothetical protein
MDLAGKEEQGDSAEKQLELLVRKVIRMAREAPPEFAQRGECFLVRTVWRDFVMMKWLHYAGHTN